MDELQKSKPHYFKSTKTDSEGFPKGWLFGKTPQEGSDGAGKGAGEKTDAQKFGEMLAASKMSGTNAAEKAAETYFK